MVLQHREGCRTTRWVLRRKEYDYTTGWEKGAWGSCCTAGKLPHNKEGHCTTRRELHTKEATAPQRNMLYNMKSTAPQGRLMYNTMTTAK